MNGYWVKTSQICCVTSAQTPLSHLLCHTTGVARVRVPDHVPVAPGPWLSISQLVSREFIPLRLVSSSLFDRGRN